jgi:flagellin-like protein
MVMNDEERGQSEVIGVVLLLAITIAAVTVTVATGSVALGLVTDEAQSASVENGLSQLSSQSSLVALGETDARRFDLGSVDGGTLRLDESAGRVEVRIETANGTTSVYNDSIGTLSYAGAQRTVAIQGGGVWSLDGGRGRMISPPEYHYRGETLTFPIVRLRQSGSSTAGGTGVVRQPPTVSGAVAETANPLRNGTVVVEIQSRYYEGWYDFFAGRSDGTVTKDDANRTTTARLVVPEEVSFDRTLAVSDADGYSHTGNKNNELSESDYVEGGSYPDPEPLIRDQIAAAAASNDNATEPCVTATSFDGCGTVGSGVYYFGGDTTVTDDFSFDTSGGDVVVAIDGDLHIDDNNIAVQSGNDNGVTYFINGSLDLQGSPTVSVDNASRNVFYVDDGFLQGSAGDGNPTIEGIVYAPNADVVTKGNPTLQGAFVTKSLSTGGNANVTYDSSLRGERIRITGGAGQDAITYLHVSENVVVVDFDG